MDFYAAKIYSNVQLMYNKCNILFKLYEKYQ